MEREQRSEGLLWDFIRANCQRMKHELAKRDCGLGQYHRDPGAAAAVILLQLHSQCVKRTHTITHTRATTRRPHTHWHTQCHNWPAKSGWAWNQAKKKKTKKKHRCQRARTRGPTLWIHPNIKLGHLRCLQQIVRVRVCMRVSMCLPPCMFVLTAFIFHIGWKKKKRKKKKRWSFFFFIVSAQSLIHTVPQ